MNVENLPIVRLYRLKSTLKNTLGTLVGDNLILSTLELPFLDNQKSVSSIPKNGSLGWAGHYCPDKPYIVVPRKSKKFGNHFHVLEDFDERDYILFHTLNFYYQTNGCIGVGMYVKDIDNDGIPDLSYSQKAMNLLLKHYPNGFKLYIYEV